MEKLRCEKGNEMDTSANWEVGLRVEAVEISALLEGGWNLTVCMHFLLAPGFRPAFSKPVESPSSSYNPFLRQSNFHQPTSDLALLYTC